MRLSRKFSRSLAVAWLLAFAGAVVSAIAWAPGRPSPGQALSTWAAFTAIIAVTTWAAGRVHKP